MDEVDRLVTDLEGIIQQNDPFLENQRDPFADTGQIVSELYDLDSKQNRVKLEHQNVQPSYSYGSSGHSSLSQRSSLNSVTSPQHAPNFKLQQSPISNDASSPLKAEFNSPSSGPSSNEPHIIHLEQPNPGLSSHPACAVPVQNTNMPQVYAQPAPPNPNLGLWSKVRTILEENIQLFQSIYGPQFPIQFVQIRSHYAEIIEQQNWNLVNGRSFNYMTDLFVRNMDSFLFWFWLRLFHVLS